MKIGILEPSDFSEIALSKLRIAGTLALFDGKDLNRFVKDKTVLFVRLNIHINADLLSNAKKLKYICSPTTGLNHIDTEYCQKHGISIISLKGETNFLNTIRATPEHTLGLILALRRNYTKAFLTLKHSEWNREPFKGYEIYKSKIGIIGYGRVGKILANFLIAMGAEVSIYDIKVVKATKNLKIFKSMDKLITWSDTIVLCASYDINFGQIIHEKELNAMAGKYFINTARAELTDEKVLVKLAKQGHFKGLAVDVITEEQSSQKHLQKLLKAAKLQNIIITPHIGGATYTSMCRTEEFITDKLLSDNDSK